MALNNLDLLIVAICLLPSAVVLAVGFVRYHRADDVGGEGE